MSDVNSIVAEEQAGRLVLPQADSTPLLPVDLERFLNEPFDKNKSIKVDSWLWYCQQEFEGVRS